MQNQSLDQFRYNQIIENDEYRMFESQDFNSFVGKLLTYADSWGMNEKQLNAVKDILKQCVWEFFYQGVEPVDRKPKGTKTVSK